MVIKLNTTKLKDDLTCSGINSGLVQIATSTIRHIFIRINSIFSRYL